MEILRGYRMVQNKARLIAHKWDSLIFVTKTERFLGTALGTGRAVMQGYPAPPMIFNTIVDAMARAALKIVCGPQEARHRMVWAAGERNLVFYVDDERIAGRDHI